MESAVRGFEMGKFAFIDVLDAQRTLVSMRVKYLTTLDEAVSAWVVLERIYGVQLEARVSNHLLRLTSAVRFINSDG